MEIKLELSADGTCLIVVLSGHFEIATLDQACETLFREVDLRSLTHAVLDLRGLDGRPDLSQTVLLLERFTGALRRVRIAVIETEEHRNFITLLEILAANRGLKIRALDAATDLRSWLQSVKRPALDPAKTLSLIHGYRTA